MIRVFPAHNVDSLRAYVTVGITRSCVAGISSSPILIEVGFFSSPTLLCVQVFDMLTARQRQRYVLTRAACGRVSWSSWPAPIVIFLLISDLPVAGRYSASFSSSPCLGRRLRLRLRLCLVRLVASFSRASRSRWGFVVSPRSATTVAWVLRSSLCLSSSSASSCSLASPVSCSSTSSSSCTSLF